MSIFSWFGKPANNVKGSYCDTEAQSDVEYYEDEDVEEQYFNAKDRGDETIIDDKEDFDDKAITVRFDADGRKIKQGPGLW